MKARWIAEVVAVLVVAVVCLRLIAGILAHAMPYIAMLVALLVLARLIWNKTKF